MTISTLGVVSGSVVALLVGPRITTWTIQGMRAEEKRCREVCATDPEGLNYALAQNAQGPMWAIGCGFWIVAVVFALFYFLGAMIEKGLHRPSQPVSAVAHLLRPSPRVRAFNFGAAGPCCVPGVTTL